jgi:hypothetical protein
MMANRGRSTTGEAAIPYYVACARIEAAKHLRLMVTRYIADRASLKDIREALAMLETAISPATGEPASCTHTKTIRGKNAPRVYGSWRTEVCLSCGAFRTHGHDAGRSQLSAWRPASAYADATAERLP